MPSGSSEEPGTVREQTPEYAPPGLEEQRPNVARMYDYYLGGKDNFAVDRAAAAEATRLIPDMPRIAQANRAFLVRATRFLAEQGVQQFIDLGAGLPTSPSVHEIVRQLQPSARVVYVDVDPVVVAHNRALSEVEPEIVTVQQDLRRPDAVLNDPKLRELLDLSRPVAVLMFAVMHFVPLADAPVIVGGYRDAVCSGSYLALSAACSDGTPDDVVHTHSAAYSNANAQFVFRTTAQIAELFGDFELAEPGLVDITQWRAQGVRNTATGLGGVGRKP